MRLPRVALAVLLAVAVASAAAAQSVEIRLSVRAAAPPVPSVPPLNALAPALTLSAAALAPVPALLPVAPAAAFDGASSLPLVDFASDLNAIRAFLGSHPEGAAVDAERFQDLVRRVYLAAPGWDGSASLPTLRRHAEGGDEKEKALVRVLSDLPRLTAEGVVRGAISAPSAAKLDVLQKDWPRDARGRPIADAVVIGAGPAGLAAGLHAAHAGLRTIVFEAGYAAQSFSDAAMKPVYRMRTPAPRNSLVQAPFSPPELVAALGMSAKLPTYRAVGQAADDALYRLTGAPPIGGARAGLETADPALASARNELLQHFSDVAAEIGRRGGILAERSPVESVSKGSDGLWTLVVGGRVQRARKLVLAQGQVGTSIEHARFPADLRRAVRDAGLETLSLNDYRELDRENEALDSWLETLEAKGTPSRRLVIGDALLGAPSIERAFRLLPGGTRAMIVGSGESAAKAAIAALRLNPGLSVDLFVKDQLQPAQLQIPSAHAAPDAIARALKDPEFAARTIVEWEAFGTPVTLATIADLEALKASGRLRVIALGKKCIAAAAGAPDSGHTIEIAVVRGGGRSLIRVYAVDPEVVAQLRRDGVGAEEPRTGRWVVSEIDGPLVSAVGYDRGSLRRDPITWSLVEAGRLRPSEGRTKATAHEFAMSRENPLRSAVDPDLYFVGAQNVSMSADSAIPGAVARAASVAADIAASLAPPGRPHVGWRERLLSFVRRVLSRR